MLLPIYAYGQKVLKKKTEKIDKDYSGLEELISNMWETMYHANGVGLAAPQIGLPIRLFIVDTVQMMEEGQEDKGIKMVFINAQKIEEKGAPWNYEEGCLSIPDVRGEVERLSTIKLRFFNENFEEMEGQFSGINGRVIQHEFDHTEGILFTELLKPIKKRLIRKKLENIKKGKIVVDYKMKFALRS